MFSSTNCRFIFSSFKQINIKSKTRTFCGLKLNFNECIKKEDIYVEVSVPQALSLNEKGKKIDVKGWIKNKRKLKNVTFISISDGLTCDNLQVILNNSYLEKTNIKLNCGSSVHCQGFLQDSVGSKQAIELNCENINVLGNCDLQDYPFTNKSATSEDWKQIRHKIHLRPKVTKYAALMRLRSDLLYNIHDIMNKNGFVNVTVPMLTSTDCEGGCQIFQVEPLEKTSEPFFEKPAKLTVSGQLHLEAAIGALSRVYTIGPAFRAENAKSRRHLCEFTMFEVEEAFINNLDDLMNRAESIFQALIDRLYLELNPNLDLILKKTNYKLIEKLRKKYFRITYDEAIDLINKRDSLHPAVHGKDLIPYHENILLDYFEHQPIFITHFPISLKPFYMKSDQDKALCFDLIGPVSGEICGGSLREDNYEILSRRLDNMKTKNDLQWYLELRKFGNAPHGGFGFGFDRLIQCMTGLANIKDVVPFPRWAHHCKL